jgi:hypothetical protein
MRRTIPELRAVDATLTKATATLKAAVTRATPAVIGESISAKVARMMAENEGFRYSPQAHRDATTKQLMESLTRDRLIAAGVALHDLTVALGPFAQDVADTIEATRHDVGLTWPDSYDRLDNAGMVNVGVYRELRRSTINEAGPAELLDTYERAIEERHLATSRIDAELIEARLDRRGGIAQVEPDVPVVKRLRERVDGLRELRVDAGLEDMKASIEAAKKAISRAKLINISPVDVSSALPEVAEVVERELQEAAA